MAATTKNVQAQVTRELAHSKPEEITRSQIVKGRRSESPVSVRLSAPLLEALDRLAHQQHRKRGNLIQHILWEYVEANLK